MTTDTRRSHRVAFTCSIFALCMELCSAFRVSMLRISIREQSRQPLPALQNTKKEEDNLVNLLEGMGLKPALKQSRPKKHARRNNSASSSTTQERQSNRRSKKSPLRSINRDEKQQKPNNISLQTQLDYSRNGHAVLRSFLKPAIIDRVRRDLIRHADRCTMDAWKQKVEVATNSAKISKACRTVEDCRAYLKRLGIQEESLPFLQHFNTWRHISSVRDDLCLSPYMAEAASILMDVPTVRLYQDALFCKRANDGPTPWHSDARMAPFDTSSMITFWIPLQPIPKKHGTGLIFVDKSHNDFALPYWNEFGGTEYERLEERYNGSMAHYMPMRVGDVTVHAGWTLHCSDANTLDQDRYALAVTYVDGRAEVRKDALDHESECGKSDNEDQWSYQEWVRQVKPRSEFQHDFVPIVWPSMSD